MEAVDALGCRRLRMRGACQRRRTLANVIEGDADHVGGTGDRLADQLRRQAEMGIARLKLLAARRHVDRLATDRTGDEAVDFNGKVCTRQLTPPDDTRPPQIRKAATRRAWPRRDGTVAAPPGSVIIKWQDALWSVRARRSGGLLLPAEVSSIGRAAQRGLGAGRRAEGLLA